MHHDFPPFIQSAAETVNKAKDSIDLPPDSLPSQELLRQQALWLAPARSRLLRRIGITQKRRVLDLGAGYGAITPELVRRSAGCVVALDSSFSSLREIHPSPKCFRIAGRMPLAPLASAFFDLIFCQCAFLWMHPVYSIVAEIRRLLEPNAELVALEPDYGAMIEYPPTIATRNIWLSAMQRAGADPHIGRKLPTILENNNFAVRVSLLDELLPPAPERLQFLYELPLTDKERYRLESIEENIPAEGSWQHVAHLPYFLIIAKKVP